MPFRFAARHAALVALLVAVPPAALHAQENSTRFGVPLHLDLGLPQGEFAQNVQVAGGFGGGLMIAIARHVALRAELDFMIYGNERRTYEVNLGPAGIVDVDVTTTNAIVHGGIGAQVGTPGPRPTPYLGGMIGFSNFSTTSRVEGFDTNDEPIQERTNMSDNTLSKSLYAGFYFPTNGGVSWDLGVRYTWNGESVRYLTRGDIVDDGFGNVVLNPRETRADLLTVRLGIMLGGKRR